MANYIHETAVIKDGAILGEGVKVGPFCVIGPRVVLKDGVELKSHVCVDGNTSVGENCTLYPFASIGMPPQDLKYAGEENQLTIGANNIIREYVTIHPGTKGGGRLTAVGNNCLLMVGVHIAHDCIIGNNVIMANNVNLAGHVQVDDKVIIGGLVGVHQYVKIGRFAMIGGMCGVDKDVIPYSLIKGQRAFMAGLNMVGLRRHGFSKEELDNLRSAYEIIASDLVPMQERVSKVEELFSKDSNISNMTKFMRGSIQKGFCMPYVS